MATTNSTTSAAIGYVEAAPATPEELNTARNRYRDEPSQLNKELFMKTLLGVRFLTLARAIPAPGHKIKWDLPVLESAELGSRTPVFTSESEFEKWAAQYGASLGKNTLSPVNPVSLFPLIDAADISGFVIDPTGVNIPVSTPLMVEFLGHLKLPKNKLDVIGQVPVAASGLLRSLIVDAVDASPTIRKVWVTWSLSTMGFLFILDLDGEERTDLGKFGQRVTPATEGWPVHVMTAGNPRALTVTDTTPIWTR